MLSQTKMTELVKGQHEAPQWAQLRELAREALESLGPLAEAARILAELPSELRLGEVEPVIVEASPDVVVLEPEVAAVTIPEEPAIESEVGNSAVNLAPDVPVEPAKRARSTSKAEKLKRVPRAKKSSKSKKKKSPEQALSS
jgi:hypothetical protein